MQLKDATAIVASIIRERNKIPLTIDTERYLPNQKTYHDGNMMRGGIRKALRIIEQAPLIDAVPVVRCKNCANRGSSYDCPMHRIFVPVEGSVYYEDFTDDEGYCFKGTPK